MKEFNKITGVSQSSKVISFPDDMLKKIEKIIKDMDCSLSTFVVEAVKYALKTKK